MKIPYIKIYAADLLAASRNLTAEQLGDALLGVCEQAFENHTLYEPQTPREKAFFQLLCGWKDEAKTAYMQHKKSGRKGGLSTQQKNKEIDGSELQTTASSTVNKQPETEPETKPYTEPEPENINTPIPPTAQGEDTRSFSQKELEKTRLWAFANEVIKHYEASVQTEEQKAIWFHKNRRQLRDIFEFCGKDTTLALRTILKCIERLHDAGLSGGYAAVCRNLPDYYAQAKKELEECGLT